MPTAMPACLQSLSQEARAAEVAELEFRSSVAREIAERERRRQYAYRRLDLADTMVKAVATADSEATALQAGLAAFKRELNWNTETESRKTVLTAWSPVVKAVWQAIRNAAPVPGSLTVDAAIANFETWYAAEHGKPFLAQFDVELPESPVVEF